MDMKLVDQDSTLVEVYSVNMTVSDYASEINRNCSLLVASAEGKFVRVFLSQPCYTDDDWTPDVVLSMRGFPSCLRPVMGGRLEKDQPLFMDFLLPEAS